MNVYQKTNETEELSVLSDEDTGDSISNNDKVIEEGNIIRIFDPKTSRKKLQRKNKSKLSTNQIRDKCHTTVQKLEKNYNKLKLQLEQSEANIAVEQLKLYRLQRIAEVTNEIGNNREIILAKSNENIWNEINHIDDECKIAEFHAKWLAHENYQLKTFINILNKVNFRWFLNRICCSASFRFG
ncbi:hypothetical protein O3M35_011049 [Rhynocoris fuscipes]|uniref:Uncharacterized protein n=1 Tax=Rhynocoris fuscipes TaxID=488301 RepID=A0AAW1CTQ3_9HEMI